MDTSMDSLPQDGTILGKRKWPSTSIPGLSTVSDGDYPSTQADLSAPASASISKRPKMLPSQDIKVHQAGHSHTHARLTMSDLPPEILQHVFSFVDPISLGRLTRVNCLFHTLLDPTSVLPPASSRVKHLTLKNQDDIWAKSRKTYLPGFPKPMESMTELESWRLVLGNSCQFCGKKNNSSTLDSKCHPWAAGPGPEGIRTIWPFRVRSCGRCLESRTIKDTELLISSSTTASALRPGLPFAILTSTMDYVPSIVLQQKDPPPHLQLFRYYLRAQIEKLQEQLGEVQQLGSAAVEEWYKGLETTGRLAISESLRFDQWEFHGGQAKLVATMKQFMSTSQKESLVQTRVDMLYKAPGAHQLSPKSSNKSTSSAKIPARPLVSVELDDASSAAEKEPTPSVPKVHAQAPVSAVVNHVLQKSATESSTFPPPRQGIKRKLQEAEQIKADRRKEIEKLCQDMNPSISPSTLVHMPAFQAAIKISQPLNDNAWKVLRPRLMSQRLDALQKEESHKALFHGSAIKHDERQRLEEEQASAREIQSKVMAQMMNPSREKVSRYAQEFIRNTWDDGRAVTKPTSSKFAAEVLHYVRQRFHDDIIQEDRTLASGGVSFPQDPDSLACRRLQLKDMEWVFNEYVRSHTDKFAKDVFLCKVCDTNSKLFSFQAIIQHYAAKHTNAFSRGSSVVSWDAEWPLDPPFDPSPNIPWVQLGGGEIQRRGLPPNVSHSWSDVVRADHSSSGSYQSQSSEIVLVFHDYWQKTDGIWNLPVSVRVYATILLANRAFLQRTGYEIELSTFISCMLHRPEMHFLRSINDLKCKVCSSSVATSSPGANGWFDLGHSLPDLAAHFQRAHDNDPYALGFTPSSSSARTTSSMTKLDWKHDMILLPDKGERDRILHEPGNDPQKVHLIAQVLSGLQPRMGLSPRPLSRSHHAPQAGHERWEPLSPISAGNSIRYGPVLTHPARSAPSIRSLGDAYEPIYPTNRAATLSGYMPENRALRYSPFSEGPKRMVVSYEPMEPLVNAEYQVRGSIGNRVALHGPLDYEYRKSSEPKLYYEAAGSGNYRLLGPRAPARMASNAGGRLSEFDEVHEISRQATLLAEGASNDAASRAAEDFLDNFAPEEVSAQGPRHLERFEAHDRPDSPSRRPTSLQGSSLDSPVRYPSRQTQVLEGHDSTSRNGAPLPMRGRDASGVSKVPYQLAEDHGLLEPQRDAYEGNSESTVEQAYVRGSPQRLHHRRLERRDPRFLARTSDYPGEMVGGVRYQQEEYLRSDGRYEAMRHPPAAQRWHGHAEDRYVEVLPADGQFYVDDDQYAIGQRDYIAVEPRRYRPAPEDNRYTQLAQEDPRAFREHGRRQPSAGLLEAEQAYALVGDTRFSHDSHEPFDQARRYSP